LVIAMPLFSSARERRLWTALLIVLAAIYATLGTAPDIAALLRERVDLTAMMVFLSLVALVVISILFVRRRPGRAEIALAVGIVIVYVMAWLRIGVASPEERTHLFEYSLVAALVHEALLERRDNGRRVPAPAILALIISLFLGWLDEGIQSLLPNRVYDLMDVAFNALAATMIIGSRWLLDFLRHKVSARRGSP